MTSFHLTHLKQLEAESIHIMREVAAEFENPVMLYSIGQDSAVMQHLATKVFCPGKPPFPLLHIDTTWKFREMIQKMLLAKTWERQGSMIDHDQADLIEEKKREGYF